MPLKVVPALVCAFALCFAQTDAPSATEGGRAASGKSAAGKTSKEDKAASAEKAAKAPSKIGAAQPKPYVIGPLDVLMVKVWNNNNLSGPVDVGPDGLISMPLIGQIKADGLTAGQLEDSITKHLSEFLNNPEVNVQVAKINSKRFFVYGGVGHPGEYPLIQPTTVMDALSNVDGFRDFANVKKIRIQRTLPSGQTQEFKFNYKDVSRGKNMEQNIQLQNGDRIFVPE